MILEWISAVLLVSGALFTLIAAVGTYRFPDIFSRMHAATKASSFGVVQMLLALAVWFPSFWTAFQAMLIIFFIFLTTPLSAHLIARACYILGIAMYEDTVVDELQGKYDFEKKHLSG